MDDENRKTGTVVPERPDEALAGVAGDAFEAFNAMETTKRRHFGLLARLDAKRERYGLEPTSSEFALLADLLADHDAQVGRFTRAAGSLKLADPQAHAALFRYVGSVAVDDAADEAVAGSIGPTH